jgi:hypothetical protein
MERFIVVLRLFVDEYPDSFLATLSRGIQPEPTNTQLVPKNRKYVRKFSLHAKHNFKIEPSWNLELVRLAIGAPAAAEAGSAANKPEASGCSIVMTGSCIRFASAKLSKLYKNARPHAAGRARITWN